MPEAENGNVASDSHPSLTCIGTQEQETAIGLFERPDVVR